MDSHLFIKNAFQRMGAKVKFGTFDSRRPQGYRVDVLEGRRQGEETFFVSQKANWKGEMQVIHQDKKRRHLLLMVRAYNNGRLEKHRYLCGHDERAWFVATVPDREFGIHDINSAMEALKPERVLAAQAKKKVKPKHRQRRKNDAFIRQGEWFFVPANSMVIGEQLVLHHERLQRGRGKPHVAEKLFRRGGVKVYACSKYPDGVTEAAYRKLLLEKPHLKNVGWRTWIRDPEVYCTGRITHNDHATILIKGWHRVYPNTESRAPWMTNLAFLD